jgi:hypothetical protein
MYKEYKDTLFLVYIYIYIYNLNEPGELSELYIPQTFSRELPIYTTSNPRMQQSSAFSRCATCYSPDVIDVNAHLFAISATPVNCRYVA